MMATVMAPASVMAHIVFPRRGVVKRTWYTEERGGARSAGSLQRRHAPLALPVAVSKRFAEHDGGRLAATVSYYSFFSVFPLMLVFVTVLGIVLEDNDELRQDLIDGVVGRIPLIGSELADDTIPGSGGSSCSAC